jgi:hypothetical protein
VLELTDAAVNAGGQITQVRRNLLSPPRADIRADRRCGARLP